VEKPAVKKKPFLSPQFPHPLGPLPDLSPACLLVQLGRRCPFSFREREDMEIRNGKRLNQCVSVFEPLFGLSWKTDDHIRTDRDLRNALVQFINEVMEVKTVITSVHPF